MNRAKSMNRARSMKRVRSSFCAAGLLLLAACSAQSGSDLDPLAEPNDSASGSGGQASIDPGDGDGAIPPLVGGGELPEEAEAPPVFGAPVITGKFLWSTNPGSGKVALIDAETLSTRVLSAGLLPTHLAGIPTSDDDAAAIVINVGTSDASLFRVAGEKVSAFRIPVHVGANQWAISPSGRFAVAFSQATDEVDPTDGLQEVTLIDLAREEPTSRRVTVGYRPSLVVFDQEEEELIVVSKLGVSLLDLGSDAVRWVPLAEGEGRDVSITQDGEYALVRRSGQSVVEIVRLDDSGDVVTLEMNGVVTDLDLAPSGRAVAVVREKSLLATFMVDEVLTDVARVDSVTLDAQLVGSSELTPDGRTAVLFTNAADSSWVSVVDLEEGAQFLNYRSLNTQTPVKSVAVSPDGAHAVALGQGTEGVSSGVFSLLALKAERFPRVVGTAAPIQEVRLGNHFGVVTASSAAGVHEAHLLSVDGLHVETMALASPPVSSGVLADFDLGFVAQSHPEGRVTFFDFATSDAQTLTGFELSSEIVEE